MKRKMIERGEATILQSAKFPVLLKRSSVGGFAKIDRPTNPANEAVVGCFLACK